MKKIVINGEKFNLEDLEFLGVNNDGLLCIAIKDKEIIYKTRYNTEDEDFNLSIDRLFKYLKNNSNCEWFKFKGALIINLSNLRSYMIHSSNKNGMLNVTFNFDVKFFKLDISDKEMKKLVKQHKRLEKEEENVFVI